MSQSNTGQAQVAETLTQETKTLIYLTLGAQDAVVVYEFPDDETAASMALAQAGIGNLRTTTMRAFTEAEIPGVLSKMP